MRLDWSMPDPSIAASPEGRDWLAFAAALYGALVATGVAVYQFVRDKPGVKIVISGLASVREGREEILDLWDIRVVNHRKRPITIESAGLLIERKLHLHPILVDIDGEKTDSPFPVTLTDGMTAQFYARRDNSGRVKGAWATDALNRSFESRYPSRDPRVRWQDWRNRRRVDKMIQEREQRRERLSNQNAS
jgi:hypothetical protein